MLAGYDTRLGRKRGRSSIGSRDVPALVWSVIGFLEVMHGLPYAKTKDSQHRDDRSRHLRVELTL
jgi:hypothetical protein